MEGRSQEERKVSLDVIDHLTQNERVLSRPLLAEGETNQPLVG